MCPDETPGVWWVGKNAAWITDGLVRLKSLRRLHIRIFDQSMVVASDEGEDGKEVCEQVLSATLPWCGRVLVCSQKDKGKGRRDCEVCAC